MHMTKINRLYCLGLIVNKEQNWNSEFENEVYADKLSVFVLGKDESRQEPVISSCHFSETLNCA